MIVAKRNLYKGVCTVSQYEIIAKRLSELRREKGAKQEDIAELLNVKRATVANYETGNRAPDYESLIKLADYYGVSCDYIIRGVKSEFAEIHSTTGLSDETVEKLKKVYAQAKGEHIGEKYAEEIDALTEEYRENINDKSQYEEKTNPFTGEKYFLTQEEIDENNAVYKRLYEEKVSITKGHSATEAAFMLETINALLEKDDAIDFFSSVYLYLFAKVDVGESVFCYVSPSFEKLSKHIDNGSLDYELNPDILKEALLFRINDYLRKWRSESNNHIIQISTYFGDNDEDDFNGDDTET